MSVYRLILVVILSLEALEFDITLLLAGSAALLVGETWPKTFPVISSAGRSCFLMEPSGLEMLELDELWLK